MAVRNPDWYNLNEGLDYPLDDQASCLDDQGRRLPQNILSDLRVRWPAHLGSHLFISAVACTSRLVTLILQTANDLENPLGTHAPVAAISLTSRELIEGRQYPMQALYPGVRAFVVFGSGARSDYQGRFSQPSQSRISARAGRPERPLPVFSMGKLNANTALTGLVHLRAEPPLQLAHEYREIEDVMQPCLVIRLQDDPSTRLGIEQTVFREFAGPCAGHPDSQSCGKPEPIEYINGVGPDCDGKITIEFEGCGWIGNHQEECAINVDCNFGLSNTCLPPHLPNHQGFLPDEIPPVTVTPEPPPPPLPDDDESIYDDIVVIGELPFLTCFFEGTGYFEVRHGEFALMAPNSIGEDCEDPIENRMQYRVSGPGSYGSYNVAVWNGFDLTTLHRKATIDLLLPQHGSHHNGGMVVNYQADGSSCVYFYVEVNFDQQLLRFCRFNGTTMQVLFSIPVPGIRLNHWYRLSVSIHPWTTHTVRMDATLIDTNPGLIDPIEVHVGPLQLNNYYPAEGLFGIGSNQSGLQIALFRLEEEP